MRWKDLATVQEAIDETGLTEETVRRLIAYQRFVRQSRCHRRANELRDLILALSLYTEQTEDREAV